MMKKTTLLKELILDQEILIMPGAHDAMAAKIIEQVGFKAVTVGGAAASICLLGKPDVSLLTLTEMTTHIKNIVEAVDIPVFADGDTGHGNVTNVIRTTREFERAGVAGFFIEDQVFPKRCGHTEGKQVIPPEEMIPKIKAAVDTRIDQDLVIMARIDSLAIYGINDAIERAHKYREAGADLIFIEALTSTEEMIRVNREVDAPIMVTQIEGGKTPLYTAKELEELGFEVVAYPASTFFAADWAVERLIEELYRTGTTHNSMDKMILFDDLNRRVGLEKVREIEAFYYKGVISSQTKNQ
jgi:carboxyvinyl-carboxyphosphonate phosphorylmutase